MFHGLNATTWKIAEKSSIYCECLCEEALGGVLHRKGKVVLHLPDQADEPRALRIQSQEEVVLHRTLQHRVGDRCRDARTVLCEPDVHLLCVRDNRGRGEIRALMEAVEFEGGFEVLDGERGAITALADKLDRGITDCP